MKTLLSIEVQGNTKRYSFQFEGDTKDLDTYHKEGLHVEIVLENIHLSNEEMAKVN
jgi:hypothetical protein